MQQTMSLKKIKCGKNERYTFAKLDEIAELPNLLDIQKKAYADFLENGVYNILQELSPITDYSGKVKLYFLDVNMTEKPKYDIRECRRRGMSYSLPLKVKTRLVIEDSGEAIEQEVYLGDLPLMTDQGSFIFNGIERVVVS